MSHPSSHICPNCGAPLIRHAFVETCPYCGYVSEALDGKIGKEMDLVEVPPKERFSYVKRQLSYIQTECPVEVENKENAYYIRAKGVFSPNDGKKANTDLMLRYEACIAEDIFALKLLVESNHDNSPIVYIKTDTTVFVPDVIIEKGRNVIAVSTTMFCALCEAEDISVETNLILDPIIWNELKTYSRRFYHSIINRQRYLYSIHQKLIIDKN